MIFGIYNDNSWTRGFQPGWRLSLRRCCPPAEDGQNAPNPDAALKGLTPRQPGDIEVTTVSREPAKESRTPAAIDVITQNDIRRSGATIIPEIFRFAPGVEVARIDPVKWGVGIRGFQSRLSRDILVLFDGRSVYDRLIHGIYWETQDTLLENIDRIEVIRGPGGNGRGFDHRIYAKGATQAPESHLDGKEFDDWPRAQTGFRIDWTLDDRDSLTEQADLYDELAGERVEISSFSAPRGQIADSNAQLSGGNVLGRWVRKFKGGFDIQIQSCYDRVSRLQAGLAHASAWPTCR